MDEDRYKHTDRSGIHEHMHPKNSREEMRNGKKGEAEKRTNEDTLLKKKAISSTTTTTTKK